MKDKVSFLKEYHGVPGPPGIPVPSPLYLARLCIDVSEFHYNLGLAYPPKDPVYWIKYGPSVIWDEIDAQSLAHKELARLQSPVKVPVIYYACKLELSVRVWSYIVMEYVPGKTVGKRLETEDDPFNKDFLFSQVALAISELHRIPAPLGCPPSGVNGGIIRNILFSDQEAPRKYKNAQELEDHLNKVS